MSTFTKIAGTSDVQFQVTLGGPILMPANDTSGALQVVTSGNTAILQNMRAADPMVDTDVDTQGARNAAIAVAIAPLLAQVGLQVVTSDPAVNPALSLSQYDGSVSASVDFPSIDILTQWG